MNIEIIEFYPIEWEKERNSLTGTLRVKLPDIGVHILGVFVSKRQDSWHFMMPSRRGNCHKTGELIHYPYIVFENREKQRELIEAIRKHGRAFIEARMTDTERPLVFPQKQQQALKQGSPRKSKDNATAAPKPKSKLSILEEQQQDPPPQSTRARNNSKFIRC